ncbi:hypothetical protein OK016_18760 [Vibrio chagasii]|nr:hypothetical protein [Vibrio chagasii]
MILIRLLISALFFSIESGDKAQRWGCTFNVVHLINDLVELFLVLMKGIGDLGHCSVRWGFVRVSWVQRHQSLIQYVGGFIKGNALHHF